LFWLSAWLSVQLPLPIHRPKDHPEGSPILANEVGDFAGTVVAALNNASEAWALGANDVINSTMPKSIKMYSLGEHDNSCSERHPECVQ